MEPPDQLQGEARLQPNPPGRPTFAYSRGVPAPLWISRFTVLRIDDLGHRALQDSHRRNQTRHQMVHHSREAEARD
jgi:hypothetical protein